MTKTSKYKTTLCYERYWENLKTSTRFVLRNLRKPFDTKVPTKIIVCRNFCLYCRGRLRLASEQRTSHIISKREGNPVWNPCKRSSRFSRSKEFESQGPDTMFIWGTCDSKGGVRTPWTPDSPGHSYTSNTTDDNSTNCFMKWRLSRRYFEPVWLKNRMSNLF